MTEQIRIIPHNPEDIPDTGSFEGRFLDGRPSRYFYWDDNRGRAAITQHMSQISTGDYERHADTIARGYGPPRAAEQREGLDV